MLNDRQPKTVDVDLSVPKLESSEGFDVEWLMAGDDFIENVFMFSSFLLTKIANTFGELFR